MSDLLPYFRFFTADWLSRTRGLSAAARGVLIDVICLAADCERRGFLHTRDRAWTPADIAKRLTGDAKANLQAVQEAIDEGALVEVEGCYCFPPMVKDAQITAARSMAGKEGGRPPGKQIESKPEANHKANGKQSESKPQSKMEANAKQTLSKPLACARVSADVSDSEFRVQSSEVRDQSAAAAILPAIMPEVMTEPVYVPDPEPEDQTEPKTAAADAADVLYGPFDVQNEIELKIRTKAMCRFHSIKRRPEWLPAGKPWLDDVAAMRIAKAFEIGKDEVQAAMKATKDSRLTLTNPAGYFIKRLLGDSA